MEERIYDHRPARKAFSRVGLCLFIGMAVALAASYGWDFLTGLYWQENDFFASNTWFWLGSIVPMYLMGLALCLVLMGLKPGYVPHRQKLGFGGFVTALLICFFLMYSGNIIGTVLSFLITGGSAVNPVMEAVQDNNVLKYVSILICAPVLEELVFRKFILDRTRHFGEVTALILSAACFGLFHMNLFQFFYAFAIGLVFGYVYLRTGRIRYSMILHGVLNFFGGVVSVFVLSFAGGINTDEMVVDMVYSLGQTLILFGYMLFLMGLFVAGLVLFIIRVRRLRWFTYPQQLPKGKRFAVSWLNVGMILFFLLSFGYTVYRLFL